MYVMIEKELCNKNFIYKVKLPLVGNFPQFELRILLPVKSGIKVTALTKNSFEQIVNNIEQPFTNIIFRTTAILKTD